MHTLLKATLISFGLLTSTTYGHSWLECSKDEVRNMEALKSGDKSVFPDWTCHGYPRNKLYHGDWIQETIDYMWDLDGEKARTEETQTGKKMACNPHQRGDPKYPDNVPAARAAPGELLKLRFWGNGHTSYQYGGPIHKDPGLVRVYYGGKDGYIETATELTVDKMIAESNFSANAISYQREDGGPDDRANWMDLQIPGHWDEGRHFMVWTWASAFDPFLNSWRDVYTTCFDVIVEGSKTGDAPAPPQNGPSTPPQTSGPNEQCLKPCYRGGQKEFECTDGVNCDPCRYVDPTTGAQNCFAYIDGRCPFGGGFDCGANKSI